MYLDTGKTEPKMNKESRTEVRMDKNRTKNICTQNSDKENGQH